MIIFQELSIIGDPIEEEDWVVHLLASLPEYFDMLVTALEASVEVPSIETVTERLLHEERKLKERENYIDEGYKSNKMVIIIRKMTNKIVIIIRKMVQDVIIV